MFTEIDLFESPDLTPLDFYLWGWMKSEFYKRNVDTRDEIPDCILGAAAHIKKGQDQLRRRTRHPRTRVAKCTEVDCGIFRKFIVSCNKFVI
jgi:hypothetical protein